MSRLYLGTNPETLSRHLAEALAKDLAAGDPFQPISLIVPNPQLGKWLRLTLARQLGIVLNVRISLLERTLWDLLRELDPRPDNPSMLDGDLYRFLTLSVLLNHPSKDLAPLRHYLGQAEATSPARWRRAWQLADRLSSLIRDYEYHRREELIYPWLTNQPGKIELSKHDRLLERAQGTLFHEIIREPGGKRALLNAGGRIFKTLPQYAGEVMEPGVARAPEKRRRVYLFGITQLSALHVHTLTFLTRFFDLQFYFLSPLAQRIGAERDRLGDCLSRWLDDEAAGLFERWSRAGVESFWLLREMLKPQGPVDWEVLTDETKTAKPTILSRLQNSIQADAESPHGQNDRPAQDCSLQILGCPGVQREVETVYQSILHNLQADPQLRMTDIAVLVTDMATYRPALQAVFERDPGRLRYSLIDHSAAGVSLWGQALLGMLDLAQENFARSRVLEVVLNPCVLTRLDVSRADAHVWLHWAEELGAYHGWDPGEREERGQAATPLFAWKQALQRLRLGRYMDDEPDPFRRSPRFLNLVPHVDIHSADRHQLDAFCRAIEGLLPLLVRLRSERRSGAWWASTLRFMAQRYLAIPEDRPEEARVRDRLIASLDHLERWDLLHEKKEGDIPLALVRQFVGSTLEGISASRGDYLTAGVTTSGLQPMRPVPFQVIYLLGMNEHLFPGSNQLSTLDLRSHDRRRGDVLPAEQNLYLFLEVLLAARSKLYLLFNNRELQKDRELLPAVPLMQLKRHLEEKILGAAFQIEEMPLHGHDLKCLASSKRHCDAFVQHGDFARVLAVTAAEKAGKLELSAAQRKELAAWQKKTRRELSVIQQVEKAGATAPMTIRLKDLREFLLNPAKAILERRLRVDQEDVEEIEQDDEPFFTHYLVANGILHRALAAVIRKHAEGTLPADSAAWAEWIDPLHEDLRLRCKAPSGPFGEVDRRRLRTEFLNRVEGEQGLERFLADRSPEAFRGPVLLGETYAPIGARTHFPPLKLRVPGPDGVEIDVRITGHWDLVWAEPGKSVDLLLLSYIKKPEKPDHLRRQMIDPLLFCLALLAQGESERTGERACDWMEGASWTLHLLTGKGIIPYTFEPGLIGRDEAVAYLQNLVRDYLTSQALDLLPLELIVSDKDKDLNDAVLGPNDSSMDEAAFTEALERLIEAEREWRLDKAWDSPLLQLLDPAVPADALNKARRRYRLLDRGPALFREAVAAKKAERERKAQEKKAKGGKTKNAAKKKAGSAVSPTAPRRVKKKSHEA